MKSVIVFCAVLTIAHAAVASSRNDRGYREPYLEPPATVQKHSYWQQTQAQVSVSVPYQLRSITDKQKLTVKVYNGRSEPLLQWWWVNYDGNPVYYSTIQAGSEITQLTYGTHPWLITTMSGDVMGVYVSNTANAKISIENKASWE